jgi:hypothetical protein
MEASVTNIEQLLRVLAGAGVEYIVIGGGRLNRGHLVSLQASLRDAPRQATTIIPAVNCWAIIKRPYGTTLDQILVTPNDLKDLP